MRMEMNSFRFPQETEVPFLAEESSSEPVTDPMEIPSTEVYIEATQAEVEAMVLEVDEAALIAASQKGDSEAFGALFMHHAPRLESILRSKTHEDEVDDAMQATFERAFTKMDRYDHRDGQGNFAAWITRLGTNLTIDQWRAAQRQTRKALSWFEDDNETVRLPAADNVEEKADQSIDLNTVLADIKARDEANANDPQAFSYTDLVQKLFLEGTSRDEYAEANGITRVTVNTRVKRMRTYLEKRFPEISKGLGE
jgi:RNA polymerase sigma factor (sigma-70 family)